MRPWELRHPLTLVYPLIPSLYTELNDIRRKQSPIRVLYNIHHVDSRQHVNKIKQSNQIQQIEQ